MDLLFSPNPANEGIKLTLPGYAVNAKITISDIAGKLVKEYEKLN